MDFTLSTEHEILRETVRSFAENEIQPVARELDEAERFSYETMAKMAELGLFGIFVSEAYGGQAMDYLAYIIAVEELARVDGLLPLVTEHADFNWHRRAALALLKHPAFRRIVTGIGSVGDRAMG